jgi:xylulose-5-phosphate/fructose-6-phosphate phosphoketolase
MEMLSEHQCEGWLEGYLLTGRHGLFNCYEAFIHIIDSMFNQHAKWLKVTAALPWRRKIASLNYLLASHVWQQDAQRLHPPGPRVHRPCGEQKGLRRARLPAARRQLPAVGDGPLPAQPPLRQRGDRGQISGAAVADDGRPRSSTAPQVSAFGTGPATIAGLPPTWSWPAVATCPRWRPWPLFPSCGASARTEDPRGQCRRPDEAATGSEHPHGLSDEDFDALFTQDKPVIFAFHAYPWLIHRLTYRRTNHGNIHVRGYKEEGTITTPFDMTVLNDLDRFHLVMDAIDRLPQLGAQGVDLKQRMQAKLIQHKQYIDQHGQDLPEIRNWQWNAGSTRPAQPLRGKTPVVT